MTSLLPLLLLPLLSLATPLETYMDLRADTLNANIALSFAATTTLTTTEDKVSQYLADQLTDYVITQRTAHTFAATTFFHEWDLVSIASSPLYTAIQAMPKGGALHLHSGSSGATQWIVGDTNMGILMDGCYVYWGEESEKLCVNAMTGDMLPCDQPGSQKLLKGTIAFYTGNTTVPDGFVRGSQAMRDDLFDTITSNASLKAMDSAQAWTYFNAVFARINPAMSYRPFYVEYLKNTFDVHFDDNVQHIEIRVVCGTGGLGNLIDEEGRVYETDDVIDTYRQALKEWKEKNSARADFTLKLIVSSIRALPEKHIAADVDAAVSMIVNNKDLVVGFDIVAEEDPNHRTLDYIDTILALKQTEIDTGVELPLYFHDGESDDRNNTNMIDAVLLGSRRVGHGFNSYYFPVLFDQMKENDITLEVNPISNQVLRYVDDLQVHPVNAFMANGINVVISSDDPGIFGYSGLTLDMWTALVSFQLNLRSLKTLCVNSLLYSGLEGAELEGAMKAWESSWGDWIDGLVVEIDKK